MTAFAKMEKQADWGIATWELRSVNHRYLEICFSLPDFLGHMEPILHKQLRQRVQRGRLDIKLRYQPPVNSSTATIEVDDDLANTIIRAYARIANLAQSFLPLNPNELLRWPNLLKLHDVTYGSIEPHLIELFSEALADLCLARIQEGQAVFEVTTQRIRELQVLIDRIKEKLPILLLLQREKILARLSHFQASLDQNRLEQEMLLFIQKIDASEELDRLQIHLNEFKRLLAQNQTHGKQLDFLLQELNRETNTLASKSPDANLSLMAVNMKVLIEEIREQVQNIE